MNKTKYIAYMGVGIALYVALGMTVKLPLVAHISTDLGYVAYGTFLAIFGVPAVVIGTIGCIIESMLVSGWFPIGWALGQIFIGVTCGYVFVHCKNDIVNVIAIIVSVFIGIGIIKTIVECNLFGIPFDVKFAKNIVATIADIIPMIVGYYISKRLKLGWITSERSNNDQTRSEIPN